MLTHIQDQTSENQANSTSASRQKSNPKTQQHQKQRTYSANTDTLENASNIPPNGEDYSQVSSRTSTIQTRKGQLGTIQARWNGKPLQRRQNKQQFVNKSTATPRTINPFKTVSNPALEAYGKSMAETHGFNAQVPEPIQRQSLDEEKKKKTIQPKGGNLQFTTSQSSGGQGLPTQLKTNMETMGGVNLSDVKVNYNSSKPKEVGALAYAQGNQIEIGPGQEKHLPHEAWHTVQQKQGRVQPNNEIQAKGLPLNDDASLEREADIMGEKALQMKCSSCGTEKKKEQGTLQRKGDSTTQFKCKECEEKEKHKKDSQAIQRKEEKEENTQSNDDCFIKLPNITLADSYTLPLFNETYQKKISLLKGSKHFRDLTFDGALDLMLKAHPVVNLQLGPVVLQNICIFFNYEKIKAGGRAELSMGASLNPTLNAYGGLESTLTTTLPTQPPLSFDVGAEGGLQNFTRLKAGTDLRIPVELAYSAPDNVELSLQPTLDLLASAQNQTNLQFLLKLMDTELCSYDHPLSDMSFSSKLSLGLKLSAGVNLFSLEPYFNFEPIIDGSLEGLLDNIFNITLLTDGWNCRSLEEIIEDLLKAGVISEDQKQQIYSEVHCVHPINWGHGNPKDFADKGIQVKIEWASSSGNLKDLEDCEIREVVTYDPIPNPPFKWNPPNPTISDPGEITPAKGWARDVHRYSPGFRKGISDPRQPGISKSHQIYQWRNKKSECENQWNTFSNEEYLIQREVHQNGGQWKYTITKKGKKNSFHYSRTVDIPDF